MNRGMPKCCAFDSFGESVSARDIYEHVRNTNGCRFIKPHRMVYIGMKKIASLYETFKKLGDSVMFVPLMKCAMKAGVYIERPYASMAYDSVNNWKQQNL